MIYLLFSNSAPGYSGSLNTNEIIFLLASIFSLYLLFTNVYWQKYLVDKCMSLDRDFSTINCYGLCRNVDIQIWSSLHVIADRSSQFELELFWELLKIISSHRLQTANILPSTNKWINWTSTLNKFTNKEFS